MRVSSSSVSRLPMNPAKQRIFSAIPEIQNCNCLYSQSCAEKLPAAAAAVVAVVADLGE